MRFEEADWVGAWGARQASESISPMIELGSGTAHLRTVVRPYIDALIYAPLRTRGVTLVHSDMHQGEGVDVSGDIYAEETRARLKAVGARSVICCNIFEHVADRARFAAICDEILAPGGLMVVTVPRDYPYHPDPIDTYFRPTPDEIGALFPGYVQTDSTVVSSDTYGAELGSARTAVATIAMAVVKSLLLRGGWRASWSRVHRLFWLLKPYRVSIVALRKPA